MPDSDSTSVNRIAVKIPPFWPADPELWFAQIENQFSLAGITADDTKFNYIAGHLDAKYAAEVRDILTNPPATEKYGKLKKELIHRLSASQDQKVKQLLEHEEIGDRKPTQFLRHLRALAGTVVPDSVLKPLWLTRLPVSTQAILATQQNADLDSLAVLADAILEANPRPQVSETAITTTSAMETMMERLTILMTAKMGEVANTLRQEISAISEVHRKHRSDSQSRSRSRSQSRSGNRKQVGVCWYHRRFADQATKCTMPCQYQAHSPGNGQGSH